MYSVFMCSSKSVGGAKLETKRIRRRSISITPEIGDDIVRWVFLLWLIDHHTFNISRPLTVLNTELHFFEILMINASNLVQGSKSDE